MANAAKPIRDKVTGKAYPSEVAAGRDLGPSLAPDAPQNNWVWYAIHRAHPDRFQTKIDGEWRDYPPAAQKPTAAPQSNGDLRKFSVTYRSSRQVLPMQLMVEAVDREEAEAILDEELGISRPGRGTGSETIEWSTHDTPAWRSAWRHGQVTVLKATKLPEGIE